MVKFVGKYFSSILDALPWYVEEKKFDDLMKNHDVKYVAGGAVLNTVGVYCVCACTLFADSLAHCCVLARPCVRPF